MKRKIIDIDQEKCTGCGQCIPDCPEGALQLIEGKVRLVSDLFCDGLGACIGTCPEGAIAVIEREAGPYDEKAVMEKIAPQGEAVIRAHLEHLIGHGEAELYRQAVEYLNEHDIPIPDHEIAEVHAEPVQHAPPDHTGCPGSAVKSITRGRHAEDLERTEGESELRQWPIQLKLLNPGASYFDNADLLVSGDCVPFAYADFHRDFLADKIIIMFCPKLDSDVDGYITKMADILSRHTIRSITVLHMEVPCCSGVRYVVDQALKRSGKEIPVKEHTILISGQVAESEAGI
jgi:ferredoxin